MEWNKYGQRIYGYQRVRDLEAELSREMTMHNGQTMSFEEKHGDVIDMENLGRVTKAWRDFTSLNYWVVRDYYRLVDYVNSFESRIQKLSDEQLTAKTAEFRRRLGKGETIANIEAVLNDGSIAEMKTGEGKTLVSTLAAYLNALTGEGHVVTVNDYLAQRDAEWMGRVHRFLGLSVGLIQRGMKAKERRSNYRCDITYTNNSELGFDYLRDNLAGSSGQLVMRWPKPFHFAIVDEVDSVLIDEGRNPLLISGEATTDAARYPVAAKVAELLMRGYIHNGSRVRPFISWHSTILSRNSHDSSSQPPHLQFEYLIFLDKDGLWLYRWMELCRFLYPRFLCFFFDCFSSYIHLMC